MNLVWTHKNVPLTIFVGMLIKTILQPSTCLVYIVFIYIQSIYHKKQGDVYVPLSFCPNSETLTIVLFRPGQILVQNFLAKPFAKMILINEWLLISPSFKVDK